MDASSQMSSVMSCMACTAFQGRRLCQPCAEREAAAMLSSAFTSGHWLSPVRQEHSQQLLAVLARNPEAVVDTETSMYAHAFAASLAQASRAGVTDVSGWPRRKLEFARAHCSKHNLWLNSRLKQLRPTTALRLYDRASILAKLRSAPSSGLALDDVVKEYERAYLDVHDLVVEKRVCEFQGTIWLSPPSTS